ncbi:hypothetical protein ABVT39_008209, partial [Epinephelus coioides]
EEESLHGTNQLNQQLTEKPHGQQGEQSQLRLPPSDTPREMYNFVEDGHHFLHNVVDNPASYELP